MKLDDLLKELLFYQGGYFQNLVVEIDGKEYKIVDAYPVCDPVIDPSNPDLKEECNHRIVFEIGN